MKRKRKISIVTLLLLFAVVLGTITSCGRRNSEPEYKTLSPEEDQSLDSNSDEAIYKPAEKNFGGYEFKILCETDYFYQKQYVWNDADGEALGVMDQAVWERQQLLYEKYNIELYQVPKGIGAYNTLATASTSGFYLCDVAALKGIDSMNAAQNGFLYISIKGSLFSSG